MLFNKLLLILLIIFSPVFYSTGTAMDDEFVEVTKADQQLLENPVVQTHTCSHHDQIMSFKANHVFLILLLTISGIIIFYFKKFRLRFLLMIISLAILGFYQGGCSCSVGSAIRIFGDIVFERPLLLTIILLAIPVISTIIFGRIFCSSACPLGALQEFLASKEKMINIPIKIDKKLRLIKFAFLPAIIIATFFTGNYFFETIDPFKAIFSQKGNTVQWILAVILILTSLVIYRPFCRFICPLAVLMNLTGKFTIFKINKACEKCTDCGMGKKVCPVNAIDDKCKVDESECIRCGKCIESCPKKCLCEKE